MKKMLRTLAVWGGGKCVGQSGGGDRILGLTGLWATELGRGVTKTNRQHQTGEVPRRELRRSVQVGKKKKNVQRVQT